MNKNLKVVVGMSGGVDSAVSALLLKNQGYHVEALFMKNWQEDDDGKHCSAAKDLADAQAACSILKIPLHTINFSATYWDRVFRYFLDEYAAYRTPNPDVMCNKEIKFKAFLDYAKTLGADYIATGHYARHDVKHTKHRLLKGVDNAKDQSYFLYLLNQEQLATTLFPIGDLTKTEVRNIAKQARLLNHAKKDSTGICFIGERKFKSFLSEYLLAKPGVILTTDRELVGQHDGLMFYTIGQRQGLKIGGKKNASEAPWYVAAKDVKNNALIVTQDREHPDLTRKQLTCNQMHWIAGEEPILPLNCCAKIRYRQPDQVCTVKKLSQNNLYQVDFSTPQWAIAPGQSVVFYDGEECLGGAIII